eukprot:RCo019431
MARQSHRGAALPPALGGTDALQGGVGVVDQQVNPVPHHVGVAATALVLVPGIHHRDGQGAQDVRLELHRRTHVPHIHFVKHGGGGDAVGALTGSAQLHRLHSDRAAQVGQVHKAVPANGDVHRRAGKHVWGHHLNLQGLRRGPHVGGPVGDGRQPVVAGQCGRGLGEPLPLCVHEGRRKVPREAVIRQPDLRDPDHLHEQRGEGAGERVVLEVNVPVWASVQAGPRSSEGLHEALRDGPGEHVVVEVQALQGLHLREAAQGALQVVELQRQELQLGEPPQGIWYGALEGVLHPVLPGTAVHDQNLQVGHGVEDVRDGPLEAAHGEDQHPQLPTQLLREQPSDLSLLDD